MALGEGLGLGSGLGLAFGLGSGLGLGISRFDILAYYPKIADFDYYYWLEIFTDFELFWKQASMGENLSWKYHISELNKKLSRTSGIFFKIRHLLPLDILKNLYYSIFSSFLCYGSATWGLSYDTYLEPLFLLQKKVLRSITFQPLSSPSTPIFFSLKILKLKDMIHQDILKFVYKSLNGLSPSHFHDYFQLSNSVHSHETRQAARGDIFQSIRNTFLYGLRSIKYFGAKLWNGILPNVSKVLSFFSICR